MALIFASTLLYAQTEISGTVVDETGEGVIGATVMEKGTSNGTVTDFDGNFKLKVEAGKILVFTYIGYEKQKLPAQNGMKVTMKDNVAELQEVVVTGYYNIRFSFQVVSFYKLTLEKSSLLSEVWQSLGSLELQVDHMSAVHEYFFLFSSYMRSPTFSRKSGLIAALPRR